MSKKLQGTMMLLLTALIWGSSFVAQRAGMEYIGPFTFNGIRSLIGGLVLIPVIFLIYHGSLYRTCSDSWSFYPKKSKAHCLVVRHTCCRRSVSAVYDGWPFPGPGRSVGAALRLCLFHPHSGDRLFLTKN